MNPITFQIEKDSNEYHTWCSELMGCHSHGKTVKEAINNLKYSMQLYIDVMMAEQIAKKSLLLAE